MMEVFHCNAMFLRKEFFMKRIVLLTLCLLVLGSSAFALDKAIGGGALLGYTFQDGSTNVNNLPVKWEFNRVSAGAFAFFGLTQYVEFNLAIMYKYGKVEASGLSAGIDPTAGLGLGVYGKYPISLSDKFVFFPTAGMDTEFNFESGWWKDLWIRGGAGVDYFLSDTLFIRGHLIYGVNVPYAKQTASPNVGHGLLVKVGVGTMF
ncbi:MAG: hypothetical protein LBG42_03620 [Treponema sp.]|jgi:hypothetical protein|nr:hypothetical protein [Treponema sp.]